MRQVKFTHYITGKGWSEEKTGNLHQWGLDFAESVGGNGSYTVGIVEDSEGNCYMVPVDKLQFIIIDPFA